MRCLTKRFQRGDTIVEVLISIAVAGSVMSITFATMNRNLLLTRVAQERMEATKQIQGQIESLIAYKNAGTTPALPVSPIIFCMNGQIPQNLGVAAPIVSLNADIFTTARYPNPCTHGFYHFAIITTDNRLYTFYARWDRVDGRGRDEIIMVFRK